MGWRTKKKSIISFLQVSFYLHPVCPCLVCWKIVNLLHSLERKTARCLFARKLEVFHIQINIQIVCSFKGILGKIYL